MRILYTLIANQNNVLVEVGFRMPIVNHVITLVNYNTDIKKSYCYEESTYHVWRSNNGLVVLCATDCETHFVNVYEFMSDIRNRFIGAYPQFQYMSLGSCSDFSRIIEDRVKHHAKSQVDLITEKIKDLQDVMKINIEKVLDREQKIEILVAETQYLEDESTTLKQTGKELSRKMWWHDTKLKCCAISILSSVILLSIIVGIVVFTNSLHIKDTT